MLDNAYHPIQIAYRTHWHKNDLGCALLTGGDVLIKFHDGAVYDGPYVLEACLSLRGSIPPGERGLALKRRRMTVLHSNEAQTQTQFHGICSGLGVFEVVLP